MYYRYEGGKITAPGIYSRVPMSRYHAADICDGYSLSSSGMRSIIWESEADFWEKSPINPKRGDEEAAPEKRVFVLGRAIHHIILGEDYFRKHYVIKPDTVNEKKDHYLNKGWIRWKAEQRAAGRSILTQAEADRCYGMAKSLSRYPMIHAGERKGRHREEGILNGLIERSIFWKDKKTGIWLKSRPDVIPRDSDDVVDLKTTRSVRHEELQKTIENYAYYQQGALIREAWLQMFNRPISSFTLVFVQSTRPYSVETRELEPEDLDRGADLNRIAIDKFAACLKSGIWPGPGGFRKDAASLALSQRARERIEYITGIKRGIQ